MNEEAFLILLRDCFQGGYTLPQFCIDNHIKRPLFIAERKIISFVWQVYVQFCYDKRLMAQFAFLDLAAGEINFSVKGILNAMTFKHISEVKYSDCDSLIFFTTKRLNLHSNFIYLDTLANYFICKTYAELPLLNFLRRYPQVKLILTNFPNIARYKGGQEFNKQLKGLEELRIILRTDKNGNIQTPLDKFGYTNAETLELMEAPDVITNPDGSTKTKDNAHPLMRIQNGKRMTAYQPAQFRNKIYFVGSCHDFGIDAPCDKTIASYLQKMLNEANLPYRVENESQRYYGRYQDLFYNLNKLTPAPDDIIFVWLDDMSVPSLPFFDLSNAFAPPHDYRDFFVTKGHVNELGYKIIAEKYFEFLTSNDFFHDSCFNYSAPPPKCYHRYGIPPQFEQSGIKDFVNAELKAYKETLRAKRLPIGALVMNCNPFTLGHQYLAEYAAAQVARLYIFVVEEDKSEFPFADRIELVRAGVKHLPNVEVLPSGKFIISQQTFSGYFNKAKLQDMKVDSSEDVEIFGQEIAPELGITIRFAGEEPTDNVTRQYNETMREILPRYGVEFREIPRKKLGDEPISASSVRAALRCGDFNKIKRLVPASTLTYLQKKYSLAP